MMLADHVLATSPADAALWLGTVTLWLLGVVFVVYRKLRASR
jgi:hypothetical protein